MFFFLLQQVHYHYVALITVLHTHGSCGTIFLTLSTFTAFVCNNWVL